MFFQNRLKYYYCISICFLILTFSSCTSPTAPPAPTNYLQGSTYVCGDLKMKFTIPNGWNITTDTIVNGYNVLLVGRKNTTLQFMANFSLLTGFYGSSDMNAVLDSEKISLIRNYPGATTVSSQTVIINTHSVGEFVYNYATNGFSLTGKQVIIINNNNLGVLTFTDLNSDYANSIIDFNNMENSIEFN